MVGSNQDHFKRCWCGAIGILIMFRLMLPASHGQSSLCMLVLMESLLRLSLWGVIPAALAKCSNQIPSRKTPLIPIFPLCSFLCLKPCLFCFDQCEEVERRAVYKVNITSIFVEKPSYPCYNRLGRHISIQVKVFKYFGNRDPYGMMFN